MASLITKKEIEHLAGLARLKLDDREKEQLLYDLQKIVAYVAQLQRADTGTIHLEDNTIAGLDSSYHFRDDNDGVNTNQGKGTEQFPEREAGYLKVPPVL